MVYLIVIFTFVLCILETIITKKLGNNKKSILLTSAAFSALGIALIVASYIMMYSMTNEIDFSILTPTWYDNFLLFNRISLIVSGILLFFCFCIRLFRYFDVSSNGCFSSKLVDISSVLSSFVILLCTLFFIGLTSGGNVSAEKCIAILGCGEALFLLLPSFIGERVQNEKNK